MTQPDMPSPPTTPLPGTISSLDAAENIAHALDTLKALDDVPTEQVRVVLQECYHLLKASEHGRIDKSCGDVAAQLTMGVLNVCAGASTAFDDESVWALEEVMKKATSEAENSTALVSKQDIESHFSAIIHSSAFLGLDLQMRQVLQDSSDKGDSPFSFQECLKRAQQGDSFFETRVGWTYEFGDPIDGVHVDYIKAFEWYSKAAVKGYGHAQYLLGSLYEFGRGIERDYEEAHKWYKRASKQGHATAWSAKHRVSKSSKKSIFKTSQMQSMFAPAEFLLDPNEPAALPGFKGFAGLGPLLRLSDISNGAWTGSIMLTVPTSEAHLATVSLSRGSIKKRTVLASFAGATFVRVDLHVSLAESAQTVSYTYKNSTYEFVIPAVNQNSHIAFFSCNGLTDDVKDPAAFQGILPLWRDLMQKHRENPFHVLVGGGDQIYMDGQHHLFKEVPLLAEFLKTPDIADRKKVQWTHEHERSVSDFYFQNYVSHFQEPEFRDALACIPYAFTSDDHDIFDGYGSYPEEIRTSPVFLNIGRIAFYFYLLFQHHTTVEHAASMGLFPENRGYNWIKQVGSNTLSIGFDVRSKRTEDQIVPEDVWADIWATLSSRLDSSPEIRHLLVIATIPVTYPRFGIVDEVMDGVNDIQLGLRWLVRKGVEALSPREADEVKENEVVKDILEGTGEGALFGHLLGMHGQPELRDDLLDAWIHARHLKERNNMITKLQQLAEKYRVRVTFLSGDVHICGMGRLRTVTDSEEFDYAGNDVTSDHRAMYQLISSGIGNAPPPDAVIELLHTNNRILSPEVSEIPETCEEMIPLFSKDVDDTDRENNRLLPRRNWASLEFRPDLSVAMYLHVENVDIEKPTVPYAVAIPRLV
ncbi:hypothetical protein HDU77_002229 [Chytriomyces hyalinus]|nr:hypothetical protein HDU77_002229 [Chytriomyces hyalinus]